MILTSRSENTGPMDCGVMRMNCLPQASLAADIYILRQGDQSANDTLMSGTGEKVWREA